MYNSGICDTKPAISLKQSSLEPKLLWSVCKNSCTTYRLVINQVTSNELWPTFFSQGSKIFPQGISSLLSECDKTWQCLGSGQL